jgi:hypothetical protein
MVNGSAFELQRLSRFLQYLALPACVALVACGDKEIADSVRTVCNPSPAFEIRVKDSQTGAFVASGATIVASTGAYADTARNSPSFPDSSPVQLGYRFGVYALSVKKSGYQDWRSDVTIKPAPSPCEGQPGEHVKVDAVLLRAQ